MKRCIVWAVALLVSAFLFIAILSPLGYAALQLPTTIVTRFPPAIVEEPEPFAPSGPFYTIPTSQYVPGTEVAVDGVSADSIPLNWWYTYDETASGPEFHGVDPTYKDGSPLIRYTYPDDGDVGHVVSQFRDVFDASTFEAVVLVARADRPVEAEITLSFYDRNLPPLEPDEPCGTSSAVFPVPIPLEEDAQVFILPLEQFAVHPWIVRNVAGASATVDWSQIFEFKIAPQQRSTIEIFRVAFAEQMPRAVLQSEERTAAGAPPVINRYYFQHPAYVIQGEDDLGAIYALPLRGVPELRTGYIAEDPDGGQLTWQVSTSDAAIGAGFQDETLYIWGADPDWSGHSSVTLTATDEAGLDDSVVIPVTVFREDKTLMKADGKKDYFVPWSPQLDINRILSVEEHMRTYHKDKGNLDRSIQWSRWKRMEFKWDIDFGTRWHNELLYNRDWPVSSQFALVDVFLSELVQLGIESVRYCNEYLIPSHSATEIYANFSGFAFAGPTKRAFEEAYIVNEAHRLGLSVSLGNLVAIGYPESGEWEELYAASPTSLQDFLDNYGELVSSSLSRWQPLGLEMVDLCPALSSVYQYDGTYEQAVTLNSGIEKLVARARQIYPGPLFHSANHYVDFFPGQSILFAPFWASFDVIGMSGWGVQLDSAASASLDQLVSAWRRLIDRYFHPFQVRFNKPFLMSEIGCLPVEGCARYGLMCSRMDGFDEAKLSTEEMAKYFIAHARAFQSMDGYCRPGWWDYQFSPTYLGMGGVRDTLGSPIRLKIDDTIQELCLGASSPPVIRIDGEVDDWQEDYRVGTDPAGDSSGRIDFTELAFVQDDAYLYFQISYASSPTEPSYLSFLFDMNRDGVAEWELFLNNIWTQRGDWCGKAELHSDGLRGGPIRGIADSIDAERSIEIRLAKRFFGMAAPPAEFRVQMVQFDSAWRLLDQTSWFVVGGAPD